MLHSGNIRFSRHRFGSMLPGIMVPRRNTAASPRFDTRRAERRTPATTPLTLVSTEPDAPRTALAATTQVPPQPDAAPPLRLVPATPAHWPSNEWGE